jgi:predicted dehydrogenase
MNRILIIGLGSIGQRHVKALKAIGEKNIAAFRTGKGLNSNLNDKIKETVQVFKNEDDAFEWLPTHLIISNPTSFHMDFVIRAIKNKISFFVEKPLCSDYKEIERIPVNTNYTGTVGYNLRFHGLFMKIKDIIEEGNYGKVLSASLFVGHYLPFWHPEQNYSQRYEARKDLGGGVLRTLSHEIDLAQYFFGKFTKLFAKVEKLSSLKIDVDDYVDIVAETEYRVRVKIHQDYLNPVVKRGGDVLFEDGLLEYDFISSSIHFTSYETKKKQLVYNEKEDYDKQYELQMYHFVNGLVDRACALNEEINNMKVIKFSEISSEKNIEVCLD